MEWIRTYLLRVHDLARDGCTAMKARRLHPVHPCRAAGHTATRTHAAHEGRDYPSKRRLRRGGIHPHELARRWIDDRDPFGALPAQRHGVRRPAKPARLHSHDRAAWQSAAMAMGQAAAAANSDGRQGL